MNIVREMKNNSDTILDKHVVKKIIISVIEIYGYIVAFTKETKDLSNLSIKEIVGSFCAHNEQRFFREDQPKETTFKSTTNENSQNFSKNQLKKNYKQKKKQNHDDFSKKVKQKCEKNSSLFCKVSKKTNHTAEKYWYKGKPHVTFAKI